MNYGEAISNIARRLGNRVDLNTAIGDEMKLAQAELEAARTLPWFLLSSELYTTISADATYVEVPTDFLREYEEGALWVEDTAAGTFTQLEKLPLDELRRVVADEDDSSPQYYSLASSRFYLAPAPTESTRLRIMCYRRADTLDDDADTNAWLDNNPEMLVAKTGMRMAQYLRSPELYAMFQGQYAEAAGAQEIANVARAMENFEGFMGGG